jgi:hypothetical protein
MREGAFATKILLEAAMIALDVRSSQCEIHIR